MSAFNVVRFQVKPGMDRQILEAHAPGKAKWPGLTKAAIIKTGDGAYCLIGEWVDEKALSDARSGMIATLDTFRNVLVPTASGVTDAVSGPVILTVA